MFNSPPFLGHLRQSSSGRALEHSWMSQVLLCLSQRNKNIYQILKELKFSGNYVCFGNANSLWTFFSIIQFTKLFYMYYPIFPLYSLSDRFSRTPYFLHFLHGQTEAQESYSLIVTWFVAPRANETDLILCNCPLHVKSPHWPLP